MDENLSCSIRLSQVTQRELEGVDENFTCSIRLSQVTQRELEGVGENCTPVPSGLVREKSESLSSQT